MEKVKKRRKGNDWEKKESKEGGRQKERKKSEGWMSTMRRLKSYEPRDLEPDHLKCSTRLRLTYRLAKHSSNLTPELQGPVWKNPLPPLFTTTTIAPTRTNNSFTHTFSGSPAVQYKEKTSHF